MFRLLQIEPDETLSSWLARSAIAAFCEPLTLTSLIWPGWRPWTVDLDRGVDQERFEALRRSCDVDAKRLRQCGMQELLSRIVPSLRPAQPIWPWLVARGSRNRTNAGGQPICPRCLASDARPYFRRAWRTAWCVGCAEHGCELLDHCPNCLAVHQPYRPASRPVDLVRCWSCNGDYRGAASATLDPRALRIQTQADAAIASSSVSIGEGQVSSQVWFQVLQHCIRHRRTASEAPLDLPTGVIPPTPLALRFELLSVRERHVRLCHAAAAVQALTPATIAEMLECEPPQSEAKSRRSPEARVYQQGRPAALVRRDWARLLRRMHRAYQ